MLVYASTACPSATIVISFVCVRTYVYTRFPRQQTPLLSLCVQSQYLNCIPQVKQCALSHQWVAQSWHNARALRRCVRPLWRRQWSGSHGGESVNWLLFVLKQPLWGSNIASLSTLRAANVGSENVLLQRTVHTLYSGDEECGGMWKLILEEKEERSVKESSRDITIPFDQSTQTLYSGPVVMQHVYNIMHIMRIF